MDKNVSPETLKPQDMTVGKAKELLDTPAGKEVLEQAVKERVAEGLLHMRSPPKAFNFSISRLDLDFQDICESLNTTVCNILHRDILTVHTGVYLFPANKPEDKHHEPVCLSSPLKNSKEKAKAKKC